MMKKWLTGPRLHVIILLVLTAGIRPILLKRRKQQMTLSILTSVCARSVPAFLIRLTLLLIIISTLRILSLAVTKNICAFSISKTPQGPEEEFHPLPYNRAIPHYP